MSEAKPKNPGFLEKHKPTVDLFRIYGGALTVLAWMVGSVLVVLGILWSYLPQLSFSILAIFTLLEGLRRIVELFRRGYSWLIAPAGMTMCVFFLLISGLQAAVYASLEMEVAILEHVAPAIKMDERYVEAHKQELTVKDRPKDIMVPTLVASAGLSVVSIGLWVVLLFVSISIRDELTRNFLGQPISGAQTWSLMMRFRPRP